MKSLARFFCLALVLLAAPAPVCTAQAVSVEGPGPAPSRARKSSETPGPFVSLQGRFVISLPQQKISGYSPVAADLPEGRVEGDRFYWGTDEGLYEVSYSDLPAALVSKALFERVRDNRLALNRGARLAGERDVTLAGHAGRELRIELTDGLAVVRTYLVGNRMYEASVKIPDASKEKEEAAKKALDSLRLLSQAEADAERERQIAEAEPSPLPQSPVAPKLKSDAEDEGLKGRVKSVLVEREDLSGTWAVRRRKPSVLEQYDARGNLTRRVLYDSKGNLFDINVYGYLDGQRASRFKLVRHEYDPPPVAVGTPPGGAREKYDPRYNYKFSYKYDDKGRLVEKVYHSNGGKVWLRHVYDYRDELKETLVYSGDGSLNQKFAETLDARGFEVEESFFDVKTGAVRSKYSYAYDSFDEQGNWTKRTTSKWVTKGGRQELAPDSVTYRTISYY